jgi:hypothetical protein
MEQAVLARGTSRTVRVRLHPVGGGQVHGTVTLTAAGGGTRVSLDVSGLPPRARAAALIHYGTCSDLAHLSASFASLPPLRANAKGRARAAGRALPLARPSLNVRLSVLADGHHAIVIVLPGKGLVACGTIPQPVELKHLTLALGQ